MVQFTDEESQVRVGGQNSGWRKPTTSMQVYSLQYATIVGDPSSTLHPLCESSGAALSLHRFEWAIVNLVRGTVLPIRTPICAEQQ